MQKLVAFWLVLSAVLNHATAGEVTVVSEVRLMGDLKQADQLSGATLHNDLLVICPDEKARLNVLKKAGDDRYELITSPKLLDDNDSELDMEGLASDGAHVYVVGSHSAARKKVEDDKSYEQNRERLAEVKLEPSRDCVVRLKLDPNGEVASKENLNLRDVLDDDKILSRFVRIPSKENGIDIEGIAISEGKLYVGFRGPVLRENWTPILVTTFDDLGAYELRFVNLEGRGIRDIVAIEGGFLLLSGPIGDGNTDYHLHFWDGKDCLPGDGAPGGTVKALGAVLPNGGAKPEGLAILNATNSNLTMLLIQDGTDEAQIISIDNP
jgi:hypothetical protein